MWYIQSDSAGGIRGDSGQTPASPATGIRKVRRSNRYLSLSKPSILPQKVATGTAYACLRPIEIPFERRSRSLSESTGASDVTLCIPFAEE